MDYKNIILEKKDGAAKIIINRPPLNILNIETLEEMNRALTDLRADDATKVVVVTASGKKAFSAGVEVGDHLGDKLPEMVRVFNELFFLLVDNLCMGKDKWTGQASFLMDSFGDHPF